MEEYTTTSGATLQVRSEGADGHGVPRYTFVLREQKPAGVNVTVLACKLPLVRTDYFIKQYCKQY